MDRGTITINKNYMLEYRYHDRDGSYKYFNRKFEIYLLEKKLLSKNYVMHMDNSDENKMMPSLYKKGGKTEKFDFGVTNLNWNEIKNNFLEFIVDEIGEENRENTKKALNKLSSPKL